MKSEPHVFSIADLQKVHTSPWEGVRNYQARNYMRDQMHVGDLILFYHSSTTPPGVVGIAKVATESHVDLSAQAPKSPYYDPKASKDNPRWFLVDVAYIATLPSPVTLARLKQDERLRDMLVVRQGQRLSVQPVEERHFRVVVELGGWNVEF